jgi:polyhydroxyalkanoate synthesis regulator phasin
MAKSGETGGRLAEMIKKAVEDGKLSNSEYDQIMALADADHHIDAQERNLLKQLQEMLSNKTVVRVAD